MLYKHSNTLDTEQIRPKVAIIDRNVLATIGLKTVLHEVMPFIEIETFGSFSELHANNPDSFVHYFVETTIVLNHLKFFSDRKLKTIVLTPSPDERDYIGGFHHICVQQPERSLINQVLSLEQMAHKNGRNLPPTHRSVAPNILTDREIEVLSLVVRGRINKEIGKELNISLNTVITHRKNITEKLAIKSVSALTIYAVMHGYVNIGQLNNE